MVNKEFKDIWQELRAVWRNSSQTKRASIQLSNLIVELKTKANKFEKDSIKRDLKTLKAFASQFEKETIRF